MAIAPSDVLKLYFETGDQPTAAQFATLIDSTVNKITDRYLLGLTEYNPLKEYVVGDATIFGNSLYKCIADTTGAFDPAKWVVLASLGSVVFVSTWDARIDQNIPHLETGIGTKGYYYVVSNANADPGQNVNLSGISDWGVGDWAIYNGTAWQKVDNSSAPIQAVDVIFEPDGDITATNVQDAIVEVRDTTDIKLATKQNLIGLKPNYIPYANTTHTLSESVISNESDGIALTNGKAFRSEKAKQAQLDFGKGGDQVNLTVDGGVGIKSSIKLEADQLSMQHTKYGEFILIPNSDNKGLIKIATAAGNALNISTDAISLNNAESDGFLKISSDGTAELGSDIFKISSTVNLPLLTDSTVPYIDASNNLVSSDVTPDELEYLSGVTSSIQDQLDAKENALGFTPVPDTRTVNGHDLTADVIVTKSDVGLGNVVNLDTSNPANITQDSTHRFVTDAQEAIWDGKQDALGFTPVPDTRTVNGHALTSNVTVTKSDVGLNNVVNLDTSNPTNITQDSTHRFVTDAEKATWNTPVVKTIAIPLTFTGALSTYSGASWTRLATPPRVLIPQAGDVFPSTTNITIKFVVDYSTSGSGAGVSNIALYDYTTFPTTGPYLNSSVALPGTGNINTYSIFTTSSFTLTSPVVKTFEIIIQNVTGGSMRVESVTMVVTYS